MSDKLFDISLHIRREYDMKWKRITAMILSSLLFVSSAFAFTDTKGHWAEKAIERLVQEQIISGYPNNSFGPNQNITREEIASILSKLDTGAFLRAMPVFSDIYNTWGKDAIVRLYRGNSISGYPDGTFKPKQAITRAEFAVVFFNMLGNQIDFTLSDSFQQTGFRDVPEGAWYEFYVYALTELGFLNGYPDRTFKPNQPITRGEVSAVIAKLALFRHYDATYEGILEALAPEDRIRHQMDHMFLKYEEITAVPYPYEYKYEISIEYEDYEETPYPNGIYCVTLLIDDGIARGGDLFYFDMDGYYIKGYAV